MTGRMRGFREDIQPRNSELGETGGLLRAPESSLSKQRAITDDIKSVPN